MPKVKSFNEACKVLRLDPEKCLPKVTGVPKRHQKALIAHAMLVIIAEALNDGWKPDFSNWGEYKYYPWFRVPSGNKSASGFAYNDCAYVYTSPCVGSRLCFKSNELAEYAGKKFKKLYKDYMLM